MTQNLTSPVFLGTYTYTYTMVRLNSYRLPLLKSRQINPIQQHDAPLLLASLSALPVCPSSRSPLKIKMDGAARVGLGR